MPTSEVSSEIPSSVKPMEQFPLFPQLPQEIRLMIWRRAAYAQPRTIYIEYSQLEEIDLRAPCFVSTTPMPVLLKVCTEARNELIGRKILTLISCGPTMPFYINLEIDELCFPRRYIPSDFTSKKLGFHRSDILGAIKDGNFTGTIWEINMVKKARVYHIYSPLLDSSFEIMECWYQCQRYFPRLQHLTIEANYQDENCRYEAGIVNSFGSASEWNRRGIEQTIEVATLVIDRVVVKQLTRSQHEVDVKLRKEREKEAKKKKMEEEEAAYNMRTEALDWTISRF